jgi:hypothetical protein
VEVLPFTPNTWFYQNFSFAMRLLPTQVVSNSLSIQPLGYLFNAASDTITGNFLVRNNGPALTGTFWLSFPFTPPGVTAVGQSSFQGTLNAGQAIVLTVSFTPASAPNLSLLLKSTDAALGLPYFADLLEVPATGG